MYMHVYAYTYTHTYVHVSTYMYTHAHTCTCKYMHARNSFHHPELNSVATVALTSHVSFFYPPAIISRCGESLPHIMMPGDAECATGDDGGCWISEGPVDVLKRQRTSIGLRLWSRELLGRSRRRVQGRKTTGRPIVFRSGLIRTGPHPPLGIKLNG